MLSIQKKVVYLFSGLAYKLAPELKTIMHIKNEYETTYIQNVEAANSRFLDCWLVKFCFFNILYVISKTPKPFSFLSLSPTLTRLLWGVDPWILMFKIASFCLICILFFAQHGFYSTDCMKHRIYFVHPKIAMNNILYIFIICG